MKRLTIRKPTGIYAVPKDGEKDPFSTIRRLDEIMERLAAIEDILGDEYDLDRLRELADGNRKMPYCPYCGEIMDLEEQW